MAGSLLVGREAEVAALLRRLADAGRGEGGVVVLAGEAGIGKSRLVAEVRAHAAAQGSAVLQGHCFPADRSLPYAPLLDLLRASFVGRGTDDLAALLGPIAPELARLVPELATRLPGVAPPPPLDAEQDKRRLFQALVEFLIRQAAPQPVLVVLEDLHWSDDTSLEFLPTLARRATTQPLLVLLTYRSDEAHPTLGSVLAQLTRARLATELTLAPLGFADVELMLRSLLGDDQPVRADALDRIYTLTAGNPFFVEEVVGSLRATGEAPTRATESSQNLLQGPHVPRSVHDAVRRRVAGLSEAARELLVLAAVAGRRVDFDLLEDLTDGDETALLSRIRELIAAHLLAEESADRFAFRHALTRQAVMADLLARERRALHARIAGAIERRYGDGSEPHLPDLAYHCYEAGLWAKARAYARRVGERAQAMYAPRAAIEQFTRALEAARALGQPPAADLLRARGQAYDTLGEFDAARRDYEAAAEAARAAGESHGEWQALLHLGGLWTGRDYAQAGAHVRRSLELARTLDDPRAVAQSLNRLGNWYVNIQQPERALGHHEEALGILEGLGDGRGVAETFDLLGMANVQFGDLLRAADLLRRAAARFETLDHRPGLVSALTVWTLCGGVYEAEVEVWESVSATEQEGRAERALGVARDIGWRAGEAFALFMAATCLGPRGHYARALDLAREALRIAEEIDHRQWMAAALTALGDLYVDLRVEEEARPYLERALTLAHETGSRIWMYLATARLAEACLLRRDVAQADALLAAALDSEPPVHTTPRRMAERARVELMLASGDPHAGLELVEALIAATPNVAPVGPDRVVPQLWLLRAEALAAVGRVDEAGAVLAEAREGARAHEMLGVLWRIHAARAALERRRRRPEAAAGEVAASEHIIDELARQVADDPLPSLGGRSLRAAFAERARDSLPPIRPPTPARAAKAAFAGLTAREREIAALVSEGRTNREIAAALVLAERTVETHLSNIFAKLGHTSRAQLAAWAADHGLRPQSG